MYLNGICVLDFSQYIPGPYATLRLADFGASVIKIEPADGELARGEMGPSQERGIVFEANNSNKQSITIDLKTPNGIELARKLIKNADVLIESFRPGVMRRLGLDYEKARKVNEQIVYCSISGYGQSGEIATLGSHDLNYLALTGVLSQFKDYEGKPVHPTLTLADHLGGIAASESIIAALFARTKTGRGTYIDIALVDALVGLMNNHFVNAERTGYLQGMSALAGTIVCYSIYETSDGRYVSLGALEKKFWENFCAACNKMEWLQKQFSLAKDSNPTYVQIKELFKSKSLQEWTIFSERVDCCVAPVLEVSEALERFSKEPRQFISRDANNIQVATRFEKGLLERRTKAPAKGEHTEKILQQLLDDFDS
ncbi:CaiB/BaiF CoA transferase family protein [Fredinandcohnia humi]